MDETAYEVRLHEAEDDQPKRFRRFEDALDYGKKKVDAGEAARAELYLIKTGTNPIFLRTYSDHASEAEANRVFDLAWEKARLEGDTDKLLKLLGL